MALTQQQVYEQGLGAQRGRVNQMYGRNLEILAREMRNRAEANEANLEARGVLRSGEANTSRQRLKEEEALQRRFYTEDRDYQMRQLELDEQARRAAMAASSGTGKPATVQPNSRTQQDIYNSFILEQGRQSVARKGDPYGMEMRKRFNIPTRGSRV